VFDPNSFVNSSIDNLQSKFAYMQF